jgi:putative photosynthetic complex assembly protein
MNLQTSMPAPQASNQWGPDNFPRWVLYCAGGIMAFSLIAIGLVRITGNGPDQRAASVTYERALRFEDRPDGAVAVIDGTSGAFLTVFRGEQGFVRGTLRALSRERYQRNIGSGPPFVLAFHSDGRLSLSDPATGEHIDLESFGPTNMAEFAPLLAITPQ